MTDKHAPELPDTVIPWWQDGKTTSEEIKEPYFLSQGVSRYFQRVREWVLFPLRQNDALTCNARILNLLAWDRNINRFEGEPESLFRLRVKYAWLNAKDAGCKAGFENIFRRLQLNILAQYERLYSGEWDVITIEMLDGENTQDISLLHVLIEQYGRTCRRYEPTVQNVIDTVLLAGEFNCEWQSDTAFMDVNYTVENSVSLAVHEQTGEFNCEWQNFTASIDVEYTVEDTVLLSEPAGEFNNDAEKLIAIWE